MQKDINIFHRQLRTGTSNFVGNISTLLTIPNNVLQGDLDIAGKNTLRFIVNTTIGIVGIFDIASAIGLNSYEKEDFGQTLGNGSWRRLLFSFTSFRTFNS